jgi:hypothetical protein
MWVVERSPQLFAAACPYQQPIGIVDCRPVIINIGAIVAVEVEHAGQRRDAGRRNVGAGIQRRFDIEYRRLAGPNGQAQGASGARAVQERIHHDGIDTRMRPLDPEDLEDWELLPGRFARTDSETASR